MTNKILIDRSVVEQALDAWTRGCPPDCKDGMTDSGGVYPWGEAALIPCPACQAFKELRAALEKPQGEQEPALVQVRRKSSSSWDEATSIECAEHLVKNHPHRYEMRLLYTHPQPKREPLTNSQINRLVADGEIPLSGNPYEVTRAIERAHGIGGEA